MWVAGHTYIIGHYNPSVTIIDLVSHTTYVVCVNCIYMWRDLQSNLFRRLIARYSAMTRNPGYGPSYGPLQKSSTTPCTRERATVCTRPRQLPLGQPDCQRRSCKIPNTKRATSFGLNSLQDCENLRLKHVAVIIQPKVKFKTAFPRENPSICTFT